MQEVTASIIGIVRHRMATDGVGVTTLVAFHGCPLRCQYCLNPQSLSPNGALRTITPTELYSEVEIDDLYFMATNGGICFGGGEPLLRSEFIVAFSKIMNPAWNLTLETSLNVPFMHLKRVAPLISEFIIDIKDMNPTIYKAYTTQENSIVLDNLAWLVENGYNEKTLIRLPLIPYYNCSEDVEKSKTILSQMGFSQFESFTYRKNKMV
ncbi:radical SAM domain protein [Prevotella disiens JCM 6334 = ATCC 29426]|uniref:Pyruvate formate-lyase 1-activating enzyme n=2 Tax=Prevotella disiens TaxID=28130 RepID=A0A379E088_9BACT|nr:radical SAM protein [Prevotella disiens]ERJ80604.1 radical SAM domain protein [Prevotella disiens JCM 6334 = ATCC 29426]SUB85692.1 Pyruvate formate-lyase 1-activating enzyme [Prevotella disiens]